MANYNKYQKLKKQYSYDGVHWSDVEPAEYKLGEVIEENSTDCGAIEPQYRWYNADPSVDYICSGYNKFYKQYYQVSEDNGLTWKNVEPIETQIGEIVEPNSIDCGYGISWEIVPGEYICKLFEGGGSGGDTPQITYNNWVANTSNFLRENSDGFTINSLGTDDDGLYHSTIEGAGTYLSVKLNSLIYSHYVDLSNVTSFENMFYHNVDYIGGNFTGWNTSNVTYMTGMFSDCTSLKTLDLSSFDTSNVTFMPGMFVNCSSLTTLDLSSFDTSNVIHMANMFNNCSSLTTLDLSHFNTSKVTEMNGMFYGCSSLTTLDLSSFDTSNVLLLTDMFNNCSSLTTLDLSSFNTSKVTEMNGMLKYCRSLTTLDLSSFNTSNVTFMNGMFYGCSSLTTLDLSSFNTSNVTDMGAMFYGCTSLKELNISGWDLTKAHNDSFISRMFKNCASLQTIYAHGCNETTIGIINNALSRAGLTDKVTIITQ